MRSYKNYILKFVLGTEIFYFLCMLYGLLLSGPAVELHRTLYTVAIPGFVWGSFISIVWGAVFWAVVGGIVGWYLVWMHNSSLVDKNK